MKFILLVLSLCCVLPSIATVRVTLTGTDWIISNDFGNYTTMGTVPGSVHTILYSNKRIPDPYIAFNDVELRFLVYSNWTFRKNFTLTGEVLSSNQVTISFNQIDTVADISLNGHPIGSTNNMFFAYRFAVPTNYLQETNQLQVLIHSPVLYALDQSKEYNETVRPECPSYVQYGECHVQFIRKEPCSFSWDWVRIIGMSTR
jgi:beta-mannosidase